MEPGITLSTLGRSVKIGDLYNYFTDEILKDCIDIPTEVVSRETAGRSLSRKFVPNQSDQSIKWHFLHVTSHLSNSIEKGSVNIDKLWFADWAKSNRLSQSNDVAKVTAYFRVIRQSTALDSGFIESNIFTYRLKSAGVATHLVEKVVSGIEIICEMQRKIDPACETAIEVEKKLHDVAEAYFKSTLDNVDPESDHVPPPAELGKVLCNVYINSVDLKNGVKTDTFANLWQYLREALLSDCNFIPIEMILTAIPNQVDAIRFSEWITDSKLKAQIRWRKIIDRCRALEKQSSVGNILPLQKVVKHLGSLLEPLWSKINTLFDTAITLMHDNKVAEGHIRHIEGLLDRLDEWLKLRNGEIERLTSLLKGTALLLLDSVTIEARLKSSGKRHAEVFVLIMDYVPDELLGSIQELLGMTGVAPQLPHFPGFQKQNEYFENVRTALTAFANEAELRRSSHRDCDYFVWLAPSSSAQVKDGDKSVIELKTPYVSASSSTSSLNASSGLNASNNSSEPILTKNPDLIKDQDEKSNQENEIKAVDEKHQLIKTEIPPNSTGECIDEDGARHKFAKVTVNEITNKDDEKRVDQHQGTTPNKLKENIGEPELNTSVVRGHGKFSDVVDAVSRPAVNTTESNKAGPTTIGSTVSSAPYDEIMAASMFLKSRRQRLSTTLNSSEIPTSVETVFSMDNVPVNQPSLSNANQQLGKSDNSGENQKVLSANKGHDPSDTANNNTKSRENVSLLLSKTISNTSLKSPIKEVYADVKHSNLVGLGHPRLLELGATRVQSIELDTFCKYDIYAPEGATEFNHKVVILLGATGCGKSALIDGMINYILGVQLEDSYRFKCVREEALGQHRTDRSLVTAYNLRYYEGMAIQHSITIIDTPGYGSPGGVHRDLEITRNIQSILELSAIDRIDAVCFVAASSDRRLSPAQNYILESVLSIFGREAQRNVQLLVTFADNQSPAVVQACKAAGFPESQLTAFSKFNLSANLEKLFWNMNQQNFKHFFGSLARVKSLDLKPARDIILRRRIVEQSLKGVERELDVCLANIEDIETLCRKLTARLSDKAKRSSDFDIDKSEIRLVKINCAKGFVAYNCKRCSKTCDRIKADSQRLERRSCTNAPCNCPTSDHEYAAYEWCHQMVKVKTTMLQMKTAYERFYHSKLTDKDFLDKCLGDLEQAKRSLLGLLQQVSERAPSLPSKSREQIVLEYLDVLRRRVAEERKIGFEIRLQTLSEFTKTAQNSLSCNRVTVAKPSSI